MHAPPLDRTDQFARKSNLIVSIVWLVLLAGVGTTLRGPAQIVAYALMPLMILGWIGALLLPSQKWHLFAMLGIGIVSAALLIALPPFTFQAIMAGVCVLEFWVCLINTIRLPQQSGV